MIELVNSLDIIDYVFFIFLCDLVLDAFILKCRVYFLFKDNFHPC